MHTIAIHHDDAFLSSGRRQSFSARWSELLSDAGHRPRVVDAADPNFFEQLEGCDGFMWWHTHLPHPRHFARRILAAVHHGMGIPVFPSWETVWHFDDKVGQYFLLRTAGIPTPRTWVFWFRRDALRFCLAAAYPLVIKLAGGIISENVRLLRSADEAVYWLDRLFTEGTVTLERPKLDGVGDVSRRVKDSLRLLAKGIPPAPSRRSDVHRGYVLLQEFLPGNDFDTRVTVIGSRAFGFRRFNRPGDFRASGSGRIDWDPTKVDPEIVRLAFRAQRKLGSQSLAIDGMYRDGEPVVVEISYYYEAWALAACPGHWELSGEAEDGRLEWVEGSVRADDAILEDFLDVLDRRAASRRGGDNRVLCNESAPTRTRATAGSS